MPADTDVYIFTFIYAKSLTVFRAEWKAKKVKFTLKQAMKAQRGRSGVLLFL
jgi:hypothetical protein